MNAPRHASIEIRKEDTHFSAAHFTVFSASERENLHGHDFFVSATATGPVDANGLCFDYNELKGRLRALCDALDETLLLPTESPHVEIEDTDDGVTVRFADERHRFLRRDVKLLAVRNVTVEELAHWFTDELVREGLARMPIDSLKLRVSSGPGQWAEAVWERSSRGGGSP